MKKFTLLITAFLFLSYHAAFPKQISQNEAQTIAEKALSKKRFNNLRKSSPLSLAYIAKQKNSNVRSEESSNNYYYIFNIGSNDGFIIISADDINVPIIGYSDNGTYQKQNLPDNFKSWMESIEKGMEKAISEEDTPSEYVQKRWRDLSENKALSSTTVDPLITTKWNQSQPYNNMTPIHDSTATYTGCVATMMAQIMKYHEHPKMINEAITLPAYTSSSLRIDIPEIQMNGKVFDWENMLNVYPYYWEATQPTEIEQDAVAKLMYYCGVSVRMNYDILGSGGSGASSEDCATALFTYFDYDKDIDFVYRESSYSGESYTDEAWINLLKHELDNGRPIAYSGRSTTAGHAFVCDGYDEDNKFHFNWGWGGSSDGYFDINATLAYTANHSVIVNAKPNEGGQGIPKFRVISINNALDSVARGKTFRLDCNVQDVSIHRFSTTYYIALYNEDDVFVEIINFQSYESGWSSSTARCRIPDHVSPGTYTVKAVVQDSNGEYIPIERAYGLEESKLTVKDEIIYHTLEVRPDVTFNINIEEGDPGDSFYSSIAFGNSEIDFSGDWALALVDKNNLSIKYILGLTENQSLKAYYRYGEYVFYGKIPMDANPGEYKLMMCARPTDKPWSLVRGQNETVIESLDFKVLGTPTGIEEATATNVIIYPNPAQNIVKLDTPEEIKAVHLYDTNGKLLLEESNSSEINISHLIKGVYILKVKTSNKVYITKLVKE